MSDPAFASARDLLARLARRELSSRELLDHFVARIERLNAPLNAVVTLDVEHARARADASDTARARGENVGPLHGLPVTIKDTWETAGIRSTSGAPQYARHVPKSDAVAVRRLVDAGAIVFGKTNTPMLGGDVQTYNDVFGVTNNAWNPAHTPGGSSGGAATAVATGMTSFELGSDIGGSIRTPSNWSGVYGLKTSYGIVPMRGHIAPAPGTLSQADLCVAGPIARDPSDLDLLLDVLAAPLEEESVGWRLALPPPRRRSLHEYRVAAWLDDAAYPVDAAVGERLHATVSALREAGATVDEDARPAFALADCMRDYQRLLCAVIAADYPRDAFDGFVAAASGADPAASDAFSRFVLFGTARHRDWLAAREAAMRLRAALRDFFRTYDVLLCPVTAVPAIPHDNQDPMPVRKIVVNGGERPYDDLFAWISIATLGFLPAVSAPVGLATGGLPVGVQIIGPYLEDRTAVDFARRLGDVIGGFVPPPGYDE